MEKLLAEQSPSLDEMGVAGAREYMRRSQHTPLGSPQIHIRERTIAGVRCIVACPAQVEEPMPVVLYLHGGGWTLGAPETHARLIQVICTQARCAVVAPDYALAPEDPYPEALVQCYSIACEIQRGVSKDLDSTRLAIAGDSAGGNLAAALAIMAVDKHGPQFALQVLICPALRVEPVTESYRLFATGLNLTTEIMAWFWRKYVPERSQWTDAHVSPLQAPRDLLARVPPACIVTAECDILRDEAEEYGARLLEAGNQAKIVRCTGTIHNFPVIDDLQSSEPSITATAAVCAALRSAFHRNG
jgi:acetyl esterase/lipase